jgi:Tol biopolymer transport system component
MRKRTGFELALIIICGASLFAQQREPVLKQINHPHPYYFREMYLPQLTTGPSSVAWQHDSHSVVYSMAGSLWKQDLDSATAVQLTVGAGYDYQPDCSPDGRWVVYSTYLNDAVELWVLDAASGQSHSLTKGGAVNLEPRFSPDGKRIAFVSTSFNGRFHIFTGDFLDGELTNVQRLTGENRSSLPRYYYGPVDHEISPAWAPDSKEIVFVSNRNHIHGTGGFWRMKAEPDAEPREIHYEETNWKAHPEFSPDGKRIVYSSYLGQPWHQLWTIPAQGGDGFPLSYGSYDNVNPRWSPDGKSIAFISNRDGNTSIWIQTIPGGEQRKLRPTERRFLKPMAHLSLTVLDGSGKPTSARVAITGEDGRAYAPDDAWMHADENFVRSERRFEAHYFHSTGNSQITVPVGKITVEVTKGFEYRFETRTLEVASARTASLTVQLKPLQLPPDTGFHWVSGDVHVHMNYGGAYRNTPRNLVAQAAAENLSIVQNLVVNKEQRVPDIGYFSTKPDSSSTPQTLLLHGQEFHTSYWGHLGLLHLTQHFLLPDYVAYANTSAASLFPANATVADMAHAQNGLVGYVHPFDTVPDPAKDGSLTNELPVDVALGKVDYIEALGFADHRATAEVWYRLLNCGFRLPAAAGTDAMANFASLRGPVGLNRVYTRVPAGPLKIAPWLEALKRGKTFATNGPLIGFSLAGKIAGDELKLAVGSNKIKFKAWLRSFVPVDRLEIICNGKPVQNLALSNDRQSANAEGEIAVTQSGWCLLRAVSDHAVHPVLDAYPYATTSPIYINLGGSPTQSPEDAAYFVAWIDRLIKAANTNQDWNTLREKEDVMQQLHRARKVFAKSSK